MEHLELLLVHVTQSCLLWLWFSRISFPAMLPENLWLETEFESLFHEKRILSVVSLLFLLSILPPPSPVFVGERFISWAVDN